MAGTSRTKRVTSTRIAELSGVSQPVVSSVLAEAEGRSSSSSVRYSDETRRRVLETAARLGYRPNRAARTLVRGRHHALGILVHNWGYVGMEFLEGASAAAWEHDQSLVLAPMPAPGEDDEFIPSIVAEDSVDGIIVLEDLPGSVEREIDRHKIPTAWVNTNRREGPGCVTCDEVGSARLAVEHLVETGRRRVGGIFTPGSHFSDAARRTGLEQGAEEFDLPQPPLLMLEKSVFDTTCWAEVEAEIQDFLETERAMDAVLLSVDGIAPRLYRAARRAGVEIPDDLAVVGINDSPFSSQIIPTLTTLRVMREEMARRAVEMLMDSLDGELELEGPVAFAHELMIRESTQGTAKNTEEIMPG